MVELDVPAMIHVSASCNPNFHATGAHYINADTTAFMQFIEGDLFTDFPTLRFIIPHGGGAVPYHWGRYRGLADMLKRPPLAQHVMKNVFFDTCVYHQPGIDLLFEVIDIDNILFGSEMVGAVRGIDPETGHYFDDTKRYIDALRDSATRTSAGSSSRMRGASIRASTRMLKARGPMMPAFKMDRDWLVCHPIAVASRASCRRRARSMRTATCSARAIEFPYAPERKYTPCDAPKEKLWAAARLSRLRAQRDRAGDLSRRRQPRDGRCAARVERPRARRRDRDAQMSPTSELRELDAAGVRGVRFNFVKRLVDVTPREVLVEIAERIQPLGWHIVIYFEAQDLPELYDFFASLPTIVVVDHMGRPDVTQAGRRRRSSSCS